MDLMWIFIGIGALALFILLLYKKRKRLGYWYAMIRGKPHIESYLVHDQVEYDNMNRELEQRRGRVLERIAIGLFYVSTLGGSFALPYLGVEGVLLLGGITAGSAMGLFGLRWLLGYREFQKHAAHRHIILSYYDADGNDKDLFFEDVVFSERVVVPKDALERALAETERRLKTEYQEGVSSGEIAIAQMDEEIARKLSEIRERVEKYNEVAIDALRASDIIQKYFRVSIDRDADPDKEDVNSDCYRPHIYTVYPGGDARRRCVLCLPVPISVALDPNARETVHFHYAKFEANVNYIRAIKIGTLTEVLVNGDIMDGIEVDLPEEVRAIDSEVPVFVATDFDWAEKQRLQGLQLIRPPPETAWYIRVCKALANSVRIGRKLEDKELQISLLEDSRERLKMELQAEQTRKSLEQADVLPPLRPADAEPITTPPQKPLAKIQALAIALIFTAVGATLMWFALHALGWTLIPP
ncbi:MAG: hypothetical protein ACTSYX_11410 [Candidatus Thorarchaeota archaeon]